MREKRIHILYKRIRELETELSKKKRYVRPTNKRLLALWDPDDNQWYFIVQVERRIEHSRDHCPQLTLSGTLTQRNELHGEAIRFAQVVGIDARLYPFEVEM